MGYKKQLKQILSDLKHYENCDLLDITDRLATINDSFTDDTSDKLFDLMNQCEDMVEVAEAYFANIDAQEVLEQELDERRYASMPR
jgi:hypothetical protein